MDGPVATGRPCVGTVGFQAGARRIRLLTLGFVAVGVALRIHRYLADFPLWCDELRLAANFIDRGFADLGRPLSHAQVCPVGFQALELLAVRLLGYSTWSLRLVPLLCAIASLFVFLHAARRLLAPVPRLLAVAILAVSWWPITFGAEVKPYATDLLVSLALICLALEWLRQPERAGWLWGLAGLGVLAVPLSLPSIFVVGGIVLGLARPVWARRGGNLLPFGLLACMPALTFLVLLPVYRLDPAVSDFMEEYWRGAFPPWRNPLRLVGWLLEAHTGTMFAYPIGHAWGGSVATTIGFALGARGLWRRGDRTLVGLALTPLALCLAAALLHRYPYGDQPRTMQFFAPVVCLFAGQGVAEALRARVPRRSRRRAVTCFLGWLLALGGLLAARDVIRPYKLARDQEARAFAARFWAEMSREAEVACARADLGLVLDPGHWDIHFTEYYLCYQAIHRNRGGADQPIRMDRVTESHPLRCVFFNENPEASPLYRDWFRRMLQTYDHRGRRKYTVVSAGARGPNFANQYVVDEFAPRSGVVVGAVPTVSALLGSSDTIRR